MPKVDNVQTTQSEESVRDLLEISRNMYVACSYFIDKSKAKGKDEKVIREECLSFVATMIHKINGELNK